eukprot:GHVS01049245.1.p1 GENE.GHVS01049245.1~~GHVS01049245.1.p1  ORF type:complete len:300 (-),score=86.77 GHVS01049245.1:266-1165(-)
MFAGVVVSAADGKRVSLPDGDDARIFHLSQLSLVKGSSSSRNTSVQIHRGNQTFVIACLQPGKVESVCVDLMFDIQLDSQIRFSAKGGNAVVHMCGYFEPAVDEEDERDDDSDGDSMVSMSELPEEWRHAIADDKHQNELSDDAMVQILDSSDDNTVVTPKKIIAMDGSIDPTTTSDGSEHEESGSDDEVDFEGIGYSEDDDEVGKGCAGVGELGITDLASTEDDEEENDDEINGMMDLMAEEGSESEDDDIDDEDEFGGTTECAAVNVTVPKTVNTTTTTFSRTGKQQRQQVVKRGNR